MLVSCFAQEIQINGSKMKIPRFEMVPFLGDMLIFGGGGRGNELHKTKGKHGRPT